MYIGNSGYFLTQILTQAFLTSIQELLTFCSTNLSRCSFLLLWATYFHVFYFYLRLFHRFAPHDCMCTYDLCFQRGWYFERLLRLDIRYALVRMGAFYPTCANWRISVSHFSRLKKNNSSRIWDGRISYPNFLNFTDCLGMTGCPDAIN